MTPSTPTRLSLWQNNFSNGPPKAALTGGVLAIERSIASVNALDAISSFHCSRMVRIDV